ncbi:MAG: ABC transporter ATP-binding protein [Candidatus Cloacimonadota bacterium]|nr:MAG: ABC transporter ATP-binding protein [Candidatus Cloacimonadota bacterium]
MLKIENLSKRYEDGKLALDQLSLHVKKGEIFVLLGANGAGKSTTINLLCNFIQPTSGSVTLAGKDAFKDSLEARKHLAYVSENVHLYENFTGFENLRFFAKLCGKNLSRDELQNTLRDIGLQEDFIHKQVKTYSKGMRQKTGIAVAIVKDADLILLDEPFSGLDPKAAYDFQQLLIEMKNRGKAILMSTHNIFKAKKLADHIGIMKDGELVMTRSKDDIEFEDLEKLYLDYMEGRLVSGD